MSNKTAIVWFRNDLRLSDHPALHAAHEGGYQIVPLFILDDDNAGEHKIGAAHRVWLHHSLQSLDKSLSNNLVFEKGDAHKIISELVEKTGAEAVFWNRCYEAWAIERDKKIKSDLDEKGVRVESFNGTLLWEPWTITNQSGDFYKVFTPFYRKGCLNAEPPRQPLAKPSNLTLSNTDNLGCKIEDLDLLPDPKEGHWPEDMMSHWGIGEDGAKERLDTFLDGELKGYKEGRNHPSWNNISRLSPYLKWGEISPNTVWYAAKERGTAEGWEKDRDHFLSELGWREFSYNLLYHFPRLKWDNMQEKFNDFPWSEEDNQQLEDWKYGRTGYPIVDAGMRQLYETGYMHNRLRMIVGSFLVKNMLTHWHKGEEWFWDCLVDGDPASNTASWQWIAGCGADAAPYFRIFNPILQSKKFDEDGEFIRQYVPELKDVPSEHIHSPWEAPQGILEMAGVTLGKDYPKPMMMHSDARNRAMDAYQSIKKAA
ncbi:MAG: deoxyribodipyrimidine photo-lyase [Pseudomonadota bacterium]